MKYVVKGSMANINACYCGDKCNDNCSDRHMVCWYDFPEGWNGPIVV